MKITVFTSNQPRHIALINALSEIADEVYAIQECNTVFPGQVKDFFNKSLVMQEYFKKVISAEKKVFGQIKFSSSNVRTISLKAGDLNRVSLDILSPALDSDYYIVFGASYIKGDLIDLLVNQNAINIHMGVSPYYRGSSCNFWAAYDGKPELVGATIHMLSKGLDSGDMLYHALPAVRAYEPFDLGMYAVKAAQDSLVKRIKTGEILSYKKIQQDKSREIRYTKNTDFDDEVAQKYLNNLLEPEQIFQNLNTRNPEMFYNPYIG